MLSRRLFIGCALCAATELSATAASAQSPPATGLKRTILTRVDGPSAGFETIVVEVEVDAGFFVARHTHPGIESSYIMQGGGVLMVDGQPDRTLKPGDAFQVPTATPHSLRNGAGSTKLVANYIVEKGKPLATPA